MREYQQRRGWFAVRDLLHDIIWACRVAVEVHRDIVLDVLREKRS
jgi:hypothetical protein